MSAASERPAQGRLARLAGSAWLHAGALALLALAYESLFLRHGLNALDEGWPLYAAWQLHEGGVLYRDAFFVFPPGHLLPAWIGQVWSPAGLVAARAIYAAFDVALCVALYLLGRRLMPPPAALLGAALLAVGAPDSHNSHYLFGYRYLLWSVLALLCLSERLRTGDRRFMLAAGALAGLALVFRLTPALAGVAGVGAGVLLAERSWRSWWADGWRFALGFLAVTLPVLAWLVDAAGWSALWREIVVRPVAMTERQSLPLPPLGLPDEWSRWTLRRAFVALQFRLYALLYLGHAAVLATWLVRDLAARRPFRAPLLLAVVTWGGLFFLRSFGRADEAHLDSTLPAACLLMAHALGAALRRPLETPGPRRAAARALLVAVFVAWVGLTAGDRYLDPRIRGGLPVRSLDGATAIRPNHRWRDFDRLVARVRALSAPDDGILDLSGAPLLYLAAGRRGPGLADVVLPGTFLGSEEERRFVARLEDDPPALVVVPRKPFDRLRERSLEVEAPHVSRWVRRHYARHERVGDVELWTRRR